MSRFSFIFFLLILSVSVARLFTIPFHSLLSLAPPPSTSSESNSDSDATSSACEGDACVIGSSPSNHSISEDLEKKIVKEWKSATVSSSTGEGNDDPSTSAVATNSVSTDPKVQELIKLGWKESQALLALNYTSYNVEEAIELLEKEEEEMQTLQNNIKVLNTQHGWKAEAAESALVQTNQNITASLELLENEEKIIHDNFEVAVKDMFASGWHEFVARQALLTQWTIDQKTAAGINVTISDESLKNIRPTLKQQNETSTADASSATGNTANKKSTASKKGKDDVPKPNPAKKEDCVFDVTSENFQKVVMESTVPVILDIYADWCGPCKQLGPMLEEAAINSGGMFRLCKVNSDAQNSIAKTFNVNSLPTVFAVNNGKMTDRFIGMLPTEQLQQFLVRAVTGYGNRVQNELSDKDFQELTFKMTTMAGMASLTFRKKEKLYGLIDKAMSTYSTDSATAISAAATGDDSAAGPRSAISSSESLQTALLYISNAAKDIMNPKFRRISTESKAYKEKISGNQCASQLLEIAGYRLNTTATAITAASTGMSGAVLELNHKNAALLQMIVQKVNENLGKMKFSQKKKVAGSASSGSSATGSSSNSQQGEAIFSPPRNKSLKRAAQPSPPVSTPSSSKSSSPKTAVAAAPQANKTGSLPFKRSATTSTPSSSSSASSSATSGTSGKTRMVDTEKIKALLKAQAAKKSSHSLSSTGIINNSKSNTAADKNKKGGNSGKEVSKQQEYFGGDSTVFLSREDNDDDEEEEEEEEEEEDDREESLVTKDDSHEKEIEQEQDDDINDNDDPEEEEEEL